MTSIGGVRDADIVYFFPNTILFPTITTDTYLHHVATDLLDILHAPAKLIPYLTYSSSEKNAYIQIA